MKYINIVVINNPCYYYCYCYQYCCQQFMEFTQGTLREVSDLFVYLHERKTRLAMCSQ